MVAGLEVAIILAGGASQLGQLAVCFHTRNGSAQCTEALVCPDQRWPLAWRFRPALGSLLGEWRTLHNPIRGSGCMEGRSMSRHWRRGVALSSRTPKQCR